MEEDLKNMEQCEAFELMPVTEPGRPLQGTWIGMSYSKATDCLKKARLSLCQDLLSPLTIPKESVKHAADIGVRHKADNKLILHRLGEFVRHAEQHSKTTDIGSTRSATDRLPSYGFHRIDTDKFLSSLVQILAKGENLLKSIVNSGST